LLRQFSATVGERMYCVISVLVDDKIAGQDPLVGVPPGRLRLSLEQVCETIDEFIAVGKGADGFDRSGAQQVADVLREGAEALGVDMDRAKALDQSIEAAAAAKCGTYEIIDDLEERR
jgi:hypothetical protein